MMEPLVKLGPIRIWPRDRAHGRFGRPLIEIDYASSDSGPLPVAYALDGATEEDREYILKWLREAQSTRGSSVDAFIPRPK